MTLAIMKYMPYRLSYYYKYGGIPLLVIKVGTRLGIDKQKMLDFFQSMLNEKSYHKLLWSIELPNELSFWDRYFQTKGLEWKDRFNERMDGDLPLQDDLKQLIEHLEQWELHILDIGSGPQTFVGKKLENRKIVIEAIDPLAKDYNKIMNRYGILPLVEPKGVDSEEILKFYRPSSFDLVIARNSLDHAYNPLKSISNMIEVTKPNCYAYIIIRPNEAENQNYHGLHQWNFYIRDNSFFIKERSKEYNVSRIFVDQVETTWEEDLQEGWLKIKLKKKHDSDN